MEPWNAMGVVENKDGQRVSLGAHNEVGRSRKCALQLKHQSASAHHAVLGWRAGSWHVRDLGSRNGTEVGGTPIGVGEHVPLAAGAELNFGGGLERWTLVDAAPPATRARCLAQGISVQAHGDLLTIPDDEQPEACIYQDDSGNWWVEHGGNIAAGVDQQSLDLPSGQWILEVPPADTGTMATTRGVDPTVRVLQQMECRFQVSLDEEHVELTLSDELGQVPLGARAHHELLLALARAKLRDREALLAPGECGWVYVDEVAEMLAIDPQNLTVTVFRARKQIADAGILNPGALIERRPRPRQMRLGPERVVVVSF